jgi:hypothetical protein
MKKIFGIFIVTLLISTTMTTIASNVNKNNYCESRIIKPTDVPDDWLEGADQYQTDDYAYGYQCTPVFHIAQGFKPTKEDLTAVALYFFGFNPPSGVKITVAIRDNLTDVDLTKYTIDADSKKIEGKGQWVMFDFDDIKVIPEETYYIVCYADAGELNNCYCWFFDVNNKYDRGIAWGSNNSGSTWVDFEEDPGGDPFLVELDLCFITYFQEPPKNKGIQTILYRLFERHPNLFQFLERFIN